MINNYSNETQSKINPKWRQNFLNLALWTAPFLEISPVIKILLASLINIGSTMNSDLILFSGVVLACVFHYVHEDLSPNLPLLTSMNIILDTLLNSSSTIAVNVELHIICCASISCLKLVFKWNIENLIGPTLECTFKVLRMIWKYRDNFVIGLFPISRVDVFGYLFSVVKEYNLQNIFQNNQELSKKYNSVKNIRLICPIDNREKCKLRKIINL